MIVIIAMACSTGNLSAGEFTHFQDISDCLIESNCCDETSYYLSMNQYASLNDIQTGGANTFGNGSGSNVTHDIGLAVGMKIPTRCCQAIRIEAEGIYRNMFDMSNDIMIIDFPTTTLNVSLDDRWSVMGNIWYDIPLCCNTRTVYLGGGVGANGGRLGVSNGTVSGLGNYTELAWQVGGGITWDRSERWTIDLGYRFVDYGSAGVALTTIAGNNPAGNFTADLTSHQLMLGIRYNSLGELFARR